ncbi:MAG: CRISPR-associated helicase Cas3' [Candidatus Gastranaerophilales bacterium]|nr:CRISPR-associated helicase Cas3' [Candidatus Gastranaerophilales bacterium]
MEYYAHSKEGESKDNWQTVKDHLENTAKKAQTFAENFNAKELAYYSGLMHDIGKYSAGFQKRILEGGKKVDHSTAGAKEAFAIFGNNIGKLMSYIIACHHGGLRDWGNDIKDEYLAKRLKKELENYDAYRNDIFLENKQFPLNIKPNKIHPYYSVSFLVKMLYSCLVDADFLDTEEFMNYEKSTHRKKPPDISYFYEELNKRLNSFNKTKNNINEIRNSILKDCQKAGKGSKGIYSLTVPTGGGKTISSMAFALEHCITYNMQKIIYVIPFTSIIEQNADVFRNIFGEENVLEHHSNYLFEEKQSIDEEDHINDSSLKLKLASENWNIPIITTTNVQFFESLYANKSSRCRKLHNITNSVIILDEAQMLPLDLLDPCIFALCELVENYGCTVVFCTATQPAILKSLNLYSDLEVKEIISDPSELYEKLKRVRVNKAGKLSDDELSKQILENDKVLCIVNTRKHAKNLYEKLKTRDGLYHLSTMMCPKHRREVLKEIREVLKKDNSICRVISTQLIEAGVDVDFPVVYRSCAGIDSIAQSAGRCNREGKLKLGEVKVFETTEDYGKVRGWLQKTASVGEEVIRNFEDILSLKAIEFYFNKLYSLEDKKGFDKQDIINKLNDKDLEFSFKSAAKEFKFISNNQHSIIVPFDARAKTLIKELNTNFSKGLLKGLRQYTVNIYDKEYEALEARGVLKVIEDSFVILVDENIYDSSEGLILPEGSELLLI